MDTKYLLDKLNEAREDVENIQKAIEILTGEEKYKYLVDDLVVAENKARKIRKCQGYLIVDNVFNDSFPEVVLDEVSDALIEEQEFNRAFNK